MTDIENARNLLEREHKTCALCRGEARYSSEKTGIAPMVDFITEGVDLRGFSAADKIVGRAAALMFALAGVAEVYAEVVSAAAVEVLGRHGIPCSWGEMVDVIVNRTGTGQCPMEEAVRGISDPPAALEAIRARQRQLAGGRQG